MTIVEFLTARLDEDEASARKVIGVNAAMLNDPDFTVSWRWGIVSRHVSGGDGTGFSRTEAPSPMRVLADVAAKRDVIEQLQDAEHRINSEWGVGSLKESDWVFIFALMAAVYSDHPDYQQEWKR